MPFIRTSQFHLINLAHVAEIELFGSDDNLNLKVTMTMASGKVFELTKTEASEAITVIREANLQLIDTMPSLRESAVAASSRAMREQFHRQR